MVCKNTMAFVALILMASTAGYAHTNYTGYSGAPGSKGTCASSCHGSTGGTITVSGFPSSYAAGQAYTVTVKHSSGSTIKQFNGSCRVGSTATNAGVIAAGTSTAVYNTTGETNGIHLSTADLDSAKFSWTAPVAGTGSVKLYIAGHQGSAGGANTELTLTATETTTGVTQNIPESETPLTRLYIDGSQNASVRLPGLAAGNGPVSVRVRNVNGRSTPTRLTSNAHGELYWNGRANDGTRLRPGTYLLEISQGGHTSMVKVMLVR